MLVKMLEKVPLYCWEGCKLVQLLWKAEWRFLKKLKIELPHDSIVTEECVPGYDRVTCTPMLIAAVFTTSKLWKQPKCPTTDEWIKKMWLIYTMEHYLAIKKN
jgi:hypothetical protein